MLSATIEQRTVTAIVYTPHWHRHSKDIDVKNTKSIQGPISNVSNVRSEVMIESRSTSMMMLIASALERNYQISVSQVCPISLITGIMSKATFPKQTHDKKFFFFLWARSRFNVKISFFYVVMFDKLHWFRKLVICIKTLWIFQRSCIHENQ